MPRIRNPKTGKFVSEDPDIRRQDLATQQPGTANLQPGYNGQSIRHGAYARLTDHELSGKVRGLVEALGDDLPVHESDGGVPAQDAVVLRLLAEALHRREKVRATELRKGIETETGDLRGVVKFGLALDSQILKLCEQMGLTPAARAKLGLDLVKAQTAGEQLTAHLRKNYGTGGNDV